jgi:hypothetical protein
LAGYIAIALIGVVFGEEKAQTCEIAWLRQLRSFVLWPPTSLVYRGRERDTAGPIAHAMQPTSQQVSDAVE